MTLNPIHLYPVHEFPNFRLPKYGYFSISDYSGETLWLSDISIIPYLPADDFKLYVRCGLIARLVTHLELKAINVAIEIECAKHDVYGSNVPKIEDYPPVNLNHYRYPYPLPSEVVGGGVNQYQIKRQMRIMLAPGSHTKKEWREVMRRDGWACLRCGSTKNLSKDHVMPIAGGGSNSVDNLQTVCTSCNSWKGARHIDFRKQPEPMTEQ